LHTVPLLAGLARDAQVEAPALDNLAALVEGRVAPAEWAETVTAPERGKRFVRAA
jgi:hypothetical protein